MTQRTHITATGESCYLVLALRQAYEFLEQQIQPSDYVASIAIEQIYTYRYTITLSAEIIRTSEKEQ